MNESRLLSRIRREIDELKLQLALGKAEASDYFEEQKGRFREQIEAVKENLENNPLVDSETTRSLKGHLDELRLQLALGRMESRDAYVEQRAKIDAAIASVKKSAEPLRDKAADGFREFSEAFDRGADLFHAKLGVLGMQLGKTEDPDKAAADTEEEQEAVAVELEVLAEKAKRAEEQEEEKSSPGVLESVGKELDGAFRAVRERLGNWFKS